MSHTSAARYRAIAQQLLDARIERGHKQVTVAQMIGTSKDRVSAWETGGGTPNARALCAWAEGLGYDVVLVPREPR